MGAPDLKCLDLRRRGDAVLVGAAEGLHAVVTFDVALPDADSTAVPIAAAPAASQPVDCSFTYLTPSWAEISACSSVGVG
jgi:hypothetical protein